MYRTSPSTKTAACIMTAAVLAASMLITGCSCSPKSKDGQGLGDLLKSYVSNKVDDIGKDSGSKDTGSTDPEDAVSDLADSWIDHRPFEGTARDQAIDTLFAAAEAGDKDMLANCFAREIRESKDFDRKVDDFLKAYPKGLVACRNDFRPGGAGGSYEGHNVIKNAGTHCTTYLDGEWYDIYLGFCFENTAEPAKVGLTTVTVMDKEARAYYLDEANRNYGEIEPPVLLCDIRDDSEVEVRIIDNTPYFWTPTDTPKLTEDEMRTLLTSCRDMEIAKRTIGMPNATYKAFNCTGYDHFYELKTADGKPRYAHINTKTDMGDIIDAYACSEEDSSTDYDNPLCPYIKPQG